MGMSSMDAEILGKLFIRNLPTSSSVTFQCSRITASKGSASFLCQHWDRGTS